jgi:hypothetical protein
MYHYSDGEYFRREQDWDVTASAFSIEDLAKEVASQYEHAMKDWTINPIVRNSTKSKKTTSSQFSEDESKAFAICLEVEMQLVEERLKARKLLDSFRKLLKDKTVAINELNKLKLELNSEAYSRRIDIINSLQAELDKIKADIPRIKELLGDDFDDAIHYDYGSFDL